MNILKRVCTFHDHAKAIIATFFHNEDDFDKAKAEVISAYESHVKCD